MSTHAVTDAAPAVRERPMLFSAPMVRAILAGAKTQTRRPIKPQPQHIEWFKHQRGWCAKVREGDGTPESPAYKMVRCPFGAPGDLLWVRETWGCAVASLDEERLAVYRATIEDPPGWPSHRPPYEEMVVWRPSIHMPRWASRLSLRVLDVRVQRLQDIGSDGRRAHDVLAEGVTRGQIEHLEEWFHKDDCPAIAFGSLWDSHYAKSAPWSSNPWVWVVEFERVNDDAALAARKAVTP